MILAVLGLRANGPARRPEAMAVAAVTIGYVLIYSFWCTYSCGYSWAWGPRYLLPAVAAMLALAALAADRWKSLAVALAFVGLVGNAATLPASYDRIYAEAKQRRVPEPELVWSLRYSPLMNGWSMAYRQVSDAFAANVRTLVSEAGTPDENVATGQFFRIVPVWWWMLPVVGLPRWPGVVAAAGMVAAGLWLMRAAVRGTPG